LCLYWIRKIRKEMKYLKRFNESNTDDVIENVKDILLPISDMGYDISVNHYVINGDTNQLIIRVVTYVDKSLVITDEVKDEFIRMRDYLQSEGYNSIEAQYYTVSKSGGKSVEEIDEFITVKEPIVNLLFNAKKIL
jgi:hypothetical protein